MEIFIVHPDLGASKRTKERLKQHGPKFVWARTGVPSCFKGCTCALLESIKTEWVGWVPIKEMHWESEDE